jgi:hypothetical protein
LAVLADPAKLYHMAFYLEFVPLGQTSLDSPDEAELFFHKIVIIDDFCALFTYQLMVMSERIIRFG